MMLYDVVSSDCSSIFVVCIITSFLTSSHQDDDETHETQKTQNTKKTQLVRCTGL